MGVLLQIVSEGRIQSFPPCIDFIRIYYLRDCSFTVYRRLQGTYLLRRLSVIIVGVSKGESPTMSYPRVLLIQMLL
jgi:hypothetical protein